MLDLTSEYRDALIKRFMAKVNKTDTCWLWTGAKRCKEGYGQIKINGRRYITSRVSYYLWVGALADDILVCHHCDNPPCIRPDHLFLGTHQDNRNDRAMKERRKKRLNKKR